MKAAIITVAGLSSRFNEGIEPSGHRLKAIYHTNDARDTLLFHMIEKLGYADKIIIVGGYQYKELIDYVMNVLSKKVQNKIVLVENTHFHDLSSGYSLYLGIKAAFDEVSNVSEIIFAEGDLDVDIVSFQKIVSCNKSVITYNRETICSNKSVVVYQNESNRYCYAFNRTHGLLKIEEPFKAIWNSGQIWKFTNTELLKKVNDYFYEHNISESNLSIIQGYFDELSLEEIEILGFNRWVNCNTRADYRLIKKEWEGVR